MMQSDQGQLDLICDEINPFLIWLYEQARGETIRSVNAYRFRAAVAGVTPEGVEWLVAHWIGKKSVRFMSFGASEPDEYGKILDVVLTDRGVNQGHRLFMAARPTREASMKDRVAKSPNPKRRVILFVSANPKPTGSLRINEEMKRIEQGLERSKFRDHFDIVTKVAATDDDLRRALLDNEPLVVHFAGHGSGPDGIALEDSEGFEHLVSGEALASLFAEFENHLKCVVLNACYSEAQADIIVEHIDFVIGMKKQIGDAAAIKFAVGFYDAIGAGWDFQKAYNLGVSAIQTAMIPEHSTPVLKIKLPAKSPGSAFWRGEARKAAEFVHRHCMEAHQGAILWRPGVTAIFGNDGANPEGEKDGGQSGASMSRKKLAQSGRNVLAIARANDGYSWCILVDSSATKELFELSWKFYSNPKSEEWYVAAEKKTAMDTIWKYVTQPVNKQ